MSGQSPPSFLPSDSSERFDVDQIRIERVKIKDLVEFAQTVVDTARDGQFIPITIQRAVAHAHNPIAHPDDVALLVAYQGTVIVGFFGIMPVLLKRYDQFHKVFWFSTWRVSPQLRGKSVGSLLMEEALSLKKDFLIVGSGPARKVCRRFGFWEHSPLVYYQLDLCGMPQLNPAFWLSRLTRRLLRPFKVRVNIENRFTRFVEIVLSTLTRPIILRLFQHSLANDLSDLEVVEVSKVRRETDEQLARLSPVQLFRGAGVVNWMLEFPWVVESGASPTERMDFYFSDVRQKFVTSAFELFTKNSGAYRGYTVFQVSKSNDLVVLKTLDTAFCDPGDEKYLLPLAFRIACSSGTRQIDLPAEAVTSFHQSWLGKLLLNRHERIYQCSPESAESPLAQAWKEIRFQYTDGDMPFS